MRLLVCQLVVAIVLFCLKFTDLAIQFLGWLLGGSQSNEVSHVVLVVVQRRPPAKQESSWLLGDGARWNWNTQREGSSIIREESSAKLLHLNLVGCVAHHWGALLHQERLRAG